MPEVIPLFPLGTVLYPGLLLPLHVFEERYRRLVTDLLELPEERRVFGVLAIRSGQEVGKDGAQALHEVGCAAALRRADEQSDGRWHVVTLGTRRFQLERMVPAGRTPYLRGEVSWLPEDAGEDPEALVPAVQVAYRAYLDALGTAREVDIEVPELPDEPQLLSYLVAATVVVDPADKQTMLAAPSARARLQGQLKLLRREQVLLRALTAAPSTDFTRQPLSPN